MATWSEENINKIKNTLQARSQASQNLAQGGQLLQQGIGQLGQGIGTGLEFITNERDRKSKEAMAAANLAKQRDQFGKQLGFDTSNATGLFAKERQKNLTGPGEWNKYLYDVHGWPPIDRGSDDKNKDRFLQLENEISDLVGMWGLKEGTLKGVNGANPVGENGIDWKNVDWKALETRLTDWVYAEGNFDKENQRGAAAYARKWIMHRMSEVLKNAGPEDKKESWFQTLWSDFLEEAEKGRSNEQFNDKWLKETQGALNTQPTPTPTPLLNKFKPLQTPSPQKYTSKNPPYVLPGNLLKQ